ncbi:DUF1499 domain-containing protein [Jannaschia sp. CCS1]|uniref:DUF1499 domain-containing protein n=1 Tax=Jannaschia sp. (strain CCS1) TaxID=290400 RepID=UPI000053B522|nr:DUF1499 domain-containing protein [Jannaschia sp. CCS1]ABD54722.1 hypothetical protein Jann_1805 [Jannaschia sp. CCS1]
MKILLYIIAAGVIATIALAAYVRLAPVDAAQWHVDPEEVTPPSSPNFSLLAGSGAVTVPAPALAVAGRLQNIAEADGAEVVAGSLGEGFVTYIVRSRIMGFPDFVTIRLVPEEDTTRLHIFSRSRHGMSDLGVNTARVQRWLTAARNEESGT